MSASSRVADREVIAIETMTDEQRAALMRSLEAGADWE